MNTPILDILNNANIFNVSISPDSRNANFVECCDYYFTHELDKEQMEQLGHEILMLANQINNGNT